MLSEFRSATRSLVRWRGGAVVAALTLAIGIGATTGLYGLARALLADLPGVPAIDRVGRIYVSSSALGVERGRVTLREFDDALSRASAFGAVGAYADEDALVGAAPDAVPVIAGFASPAFFTVMGVPPSAGRVFSAADVTGSPVVVVSHALWRRHFPDGALIGATLMVDGVERAVIGVMPPEFRYPFVGMTADLWVPLAGPRPDMPAIVSVYARLRDGIEWPAAQAELTAMARGHAPWTWQAIPIPGDIRTRAVAAAAGTMGPALLVLAIACVNVACLLMARGIARGKELGVRLALGATRGRLVRLLLVESLVLAGVGGLIGSALAAAILRVLGTALASAQPSLAAALTVDAGLPAVALFASVAAVLLFGLVPALRLSRGDVVTSLNGSAQTRAAHIAGYGARDAVVFAQVAAAVGFVVWAAMLHTLFSQLNGRTLAFPADRIVAMRVPAPGAADIAARVSAVPGVEAAAISSGMLGGGERERIEKAGASPLAISRVPVGERFLDTLGVPIVRGRSFDASELRGRAHVAVLTESSARQVAPGGPAVGLTLRTSAHGDVLVIGVCRDPIDHGAIGQIEGYAAEMYVPYEPSATSREAIVLARTSGDAHASLKAIAATAQLPPGTRPVRPIVLSDDFAGSTRDAGGTILLNLIGWFAAVTLLLAASGVFAAISQSVAQRTGELAVRLAIGATPSRVLGMVLARETKLIGAAMITGVVFTLLATRALFVELARLSAIVPAGWVGALLLSGGVASIAVAFATFRIVRLEPAVILRRL